MSDAVNRIEMEILVIDDDPNILESVGKFLRAQGHRVHLADRGEKGLEILKKNAIDITISDVHMPGMDGFEVSTSETTSKRHLAPCPALFETLCPGNA